MQERAAIAAIDFTEQVKYDSQGQPLDLSAYDIDETKFAGHASAGYQLVNDDEKHAAAGD